MFLSRVRFQDAAQPLCVISVSSPSKFSQKTSTHVAVRMIYATARAESHAFRVIAHFRSVCVLRCHGRQGKCSTCDLNTP